MMETNAERLEKLKYKKMIAERSIVKQANVSLELIAWSVQQAERAQELEARNTFLEKAHQTNIKIAESVKEESDRLGKALEFYAKDDSRGEKARQALKGDAK